VLAVASHARRVSRGTFFKLPDGLGSTAIGRARSVKSNRWLGPLVVPRIGQAVAPNLPVPSVAKGTGNDPHDANAHAPLDHRA